MQAADLFKEGVTPAEIARRLGVWQVRVVSAPQTHERVSRSMGQAEIQAVARPHQTGTTLAGAHCAPPADAVCSLAARTA
jgi:hypothetical protein